MKNEAINTARKTASKKIKVHVSTCTVHTCMYMLEERNERIKQIFNNHWVLHASRSQWELLFEDGLYI